MYFEDFCNEYNLSTKEQTQQTKQAVNNKEQNDQNVSKSGISEDEIIKKIDKYKNYNNQQLLTELLTEVNKQKKSGNLTDKNLQEMIASLSPYLDNEQKQRLSEISKLLR